MMRSRKKALAARGCIRLRGVRQNNLKDIDLDVPLGRLVVISGLSGSGKSSLAFETLFAEGQRRYIETFSPYARQFLDRMDKPQARRIEGIPPAIAIEQRNSVKSTRSTVGTLTEITDYAKVFWAGLARLHCRQCGKPVAKEPPQKVWEALLAEAPEGEALVTFGLALSEKFSLEESLGLVARQGYQRLLLGGVVVALDQALARMNAARPARLTVVQDRVKLKEWNRARFVEACEQAYHFGKGKLAAHLLAPGTGEVAATRMFSSGLHCAACDLEYREPSPALFSFNHPVGACPSCRGFGRVIAIDYDAAIPDRGKTLAGGAVKPWQTKTGAECQADMVRFAKKRKAPLDVPFRDLPKELQNWVIEGDAGYGKDKEHEWLRAWYGVKGYFRWLESKAYKMHVRVLLARYRRYETCPDCHGTRFQPEALLYKVAAPGGGEGATLADFYRLPARQALDFVNALAATRAEGKVMDPQGLALEEVRSRLGYLVEAGLGYLSLDRMTRSLSGGETERVNLTTCLGSRLVNTLFVLDEPSVGLHPRDTERLTGIVRRLRDAGNTVVVVEHEAGVMRAADQIIDLGPGHGESGGEVVFQGTFEEILRAPQSLTGQYLAGKKRIEVPARRPVSLGKAKDGAATAALIVRGARLHNLKGLTVRIPLGRFVCVTGVSGSGKSTLVREALWPALQERLEGRPPAAPDGEEETDGTPLVKGPVAAGLVLEGWESLGGVVAVDQSLLGRTPRSNPAVYIGAFDEIREMFAQTVAARQRGLGASSFSFNSAQGQCERCRGAGFEKIEMQFLSDVYVRCPECNGRRYRPHILEVMAKPARHCAWNIADLLEATVDEAVEFLRCFGPSRPATQAAGSLKLLQEVGLGYVRLGQPINTLSGGESQRLKLVSHLAGVEKVEGGRMKDEMVGGASRKAGEEKWREKRRLFIFDEPTTGLHFDDVRVLLKVFQRLVGVGHSVVVIEHNLDVIKSADWVIDLGPEGGEEGGEIVAEGTPEMVAGLARSHTGKALAEVLER
ncbi:MAG: excinuclease ABC subunit UvrA [Verrucomicrobiota bacterium]|jgi:excinuclease ABC subunit A